MVLKLLSAIVKQILLIGDTSVPEALGTKLKRGAEQLGISEKFKISVSYHSPALNYSPSMGTKRGKILYRLAGKRSLEWWGYQQNLLEKIKELNPDLILVTGILPLSIEIFQTVKGKGDAW